MLKQRKAGTPKDDPDYAEELASFDKELEALFKRQRELLPPEKQQRKAQWDLNARRLKQKKAEASFTAAKQTVETLKEQLAKAEEAAKEHEENLVEAKKFVQEAVAEQERLRPAPTAPPAKVKEEEWLNQMLAEARSDDDRQALQHMWQRRADKAAAQAAEVAKADEDRKAQQAAAEQPEGGAAAKAAQAAGGADAAGKQEQEKEDADMEVEEDEQVALRKADEAALAARLQAYEDNLVQRADESE